jgi:hypothetical protein
VSTVSFALDPVAPFRLDFSAWTLRRRPENAVDRWDGEAYQRTLTLADSIVEVTVTQVGAPDQPRLHITGTGIRLAPGLEGPLTAALERLLGLRRSRSTARSPSGALSRDEAPALSYSVRSTRQWHRLPADYPHPGYSPAQSISRALWRHARQTGWVCACLSSASGPCHA